MSMHLLAMNLALQLKSRVRKDGNADLFGDSLTFQKIYHGKIFNKENHVAIEVYIPGHIVKRLNNDEFMCGPSTNSALLPQEAECLSYYSYENSDKKSCLLNYKAVVIHSLTQFLLQNNHWMTITSSSIPQEISLSWPSTTS